MRWRAVAVAAVVAVLATGDAWANCCVCDQCSGADFCVDDLSETSNPILLLAQCANFCVAAGCEGIGAEIDESCEDGCGNFDGGTPIPTATVVATATATATGTITPTPASTPTNVIIYSRDGNIRGAGHDMTPGLPVCVLPNGKHIGVGPSCVAGGGTIITDLGAERHPDHFEELVATATGEAFVETVSELPAGARVERCWSRTDDTVTTSNSLGYMLGTEGADDLFGRVANGTIGGSTYGDATWPVSHAVYAATPLRLTVAEEGTYSDDNGVVRVVCFYTRFEDWP